MTKLVEKRLYLIHAQQRRSFRRRAREIARDGRQWRHALPRGVILTAESARPGASALAGTREEIHIQDANVTAVAFAHLEDLNFRVVDRNVATLDKLQAIEPF